MGTTKISSDAPDTGTGEQAKAQPMFHWPPAMVKLGLVQSPLDWYGPTRTLAVPVAGAAVVVVAGPALEFAPPVAVDVVVLADGEVPEDEAEEAGGGKVPEDEADGKEADDGGVLLARALPMAMPSTSIPTAVRTSCHVRQERRSLMPSAPKEGAAEVAAGAPLP